MKRQHASLIYGGLKPISASVDLKVDFGNGNTQTVTFEAIAVDGPNATVSVRCGAVDDDGEPAGWGDIEYPARIDLTQVVESVHIEIRGLKGDGGGGLRLALDGPYFTDMAIRAGFKPA